MNVETIILKNILTNEEYTRKVLPYLKTSYFEDNYRLIFKQICRYVSKYNRLPPRESFEVDLQESDIPEQKLADIFQIIPHLYNPEKTDEEWLMDRTEKWCQERAIYNAIFDSINILEGKDETHTKNAIPELLTKALGVGFNSSIGHDYFGDVENRFDYYHQEESRIPFDLEYFNKITKGGLPKKSLFVLMASTGVGKSLVMCHMAAANLSQGYNVLYITMEMSEEKISERIDANLLDTPINEIGHITKSDFMGRIEHLRKGTNGRLIVKEYPTSAANTSHFRALLNDLRLKKEFVPDIVYIDYLNICASARLRNLGGSVNSYNYIKAIAEEVRGLAVEFKVPIVTATQSNRSAFKSSDPDLDNTSESFGLPATADGMVALISNDEFEEQGKICVKQLKNRYADLYRPRKFFVGIDRSKMRLFDLPDDEQEYMSGGGMEEDQPVMDHSDRYHDIANKVEGFVFDES
jgi:replicative DNA helicase